MDQSEVLNSWAGIGTLTYCQLDQRMSILLAMNKHRWQSLLLCFVLHMPNIIKLKLYNNRSAQAVNIISECAM